MQKKVIVANNGQSVIIDDFNQVGENAGLVDDRVYAELLHMAKYDGVTVSRGVIPDRFDDGDKDGNFIRDNGATGKVRVAPFRAFIGSRTTFAGNVLLNHEDIRSALALGSSTAYHTVTIAANASGNPRWDLIYATVSVDANGPTVSRKVKDPTSGDIVDTNVVVYKQTTVAVNILAGTPAASPTLPTIPADSGSTYYIPLAYIAVPDGHNATTVVPANRIYVVAPVLSLSREVGGSRFDFGTEHSAVDGSILTSAQILAWVQSTSVWPQLYMGSTATGGVDHVLIAVNGKTGQVNPVSDSIVDTRDWRGRLVKSTAVGQADGNGYLSYAWEYASTTLTVDGFPNAFRSDTTTPGVCVGVSQTIQGDSSDECEIARYTSNSGSGKYATIYCDMTTGNLKVRYTNSPDTLMLFWLEFSPRIERAT